MFITQITQRGHVMVIVSSPVTHTYEKVKSN